MTSPRPTVGIWTDYPPGINWSHEGMTRLLAFILEGAAVAKRYRFRIVVSHDIYPQAVADLGEINAELGEDFTVHAIDEPSSDPAIDGEATLALANALPDVEGWISMFPHFSSARGLHRPVAALFPDAIPLGFPLFTPSVWDEGGPHTVWSERTAELLKAASRVITFSNHVAEDQVQRWFEVPRDSIRVIPHAAPDISHLLPFVKGRTRTPESLALAGNILRRHARDRGWAYLSDFPFESTHFLVVSTQDRPTKNIVVAAQALEILLRRRHRNVKLFTTAKIHRDYDWTLFPDRVATERLEVDIMSLHSLPRDVHAALYHCATAAVHPALFEGGLGPFPFYEAVSVGTPCLIAMGPHTREFIRWEPDLSSWTFDPDDPARLAALVEDTFQARDAILAAQTKVYLSTLKRTWAIVSSEYAEAALHRTQRECVSVENTERSATRPHAFVTPCKS